MPVSLTSTPVGISFWIHVSPGAKRASVGGVHGDALRVVVTAPPHEGRANAACVDALAAAFAVRRAAVSLDPAAKSRRKRVAITGDPTTLAAQLGALASES